MRQITPCIWFQGDAEDAMNYYVSTFGDSKIVQIERYSGDQGIPNEKELKGKVLTGIFELEGQRFMCLDGGPGFEMTGAISFMVEFETQQELDAVWNRLLDGGKPMQCGWVTDKFGVTWQIAPVSLGRMLSEPTATPAQKQAVMEAMMPMVKLDSAELEAAFESAR